jgi:hypothetical protein
MKYRLFLTELKKGGPSDPIYLSTPTSELPLQCAGDPLGMHLVKRQRYEHMSELLAPYNYRINWHIVPPYVARAGQMPSLRGGTVCMFITPGGTKPKGP